MHDPRAGETLLARFDFLREGDAYRVVELNAETPFFIVESFAESGRRARAAGLRDPNDGERERLGDAIAGALEPLAASARVGVVATNVHREDVGTAYFLRDLIASRVGAEVVFVPVHELAVEDGACAMRTVRSTCCTAAIRSSTLPPIPADRRCSTPSRAARAGC